MQEGMLPYMIATNQYNFPVLIVPVLVLYLRLSTKVNTSMLPVPVQLTLISHYVIQQLTLVVLKNGQLW